MIYIKKFENHSEYEAFTASTEFVLPNVSYCVNENDTHYTPKGESSLNEYFTIEAIDDNCKIDLECPTYGGVSISTDGGSTWSEKAGSTSITINSGEKVLCKGDMSFIDSTSNHYNFLTLSGRANIRGNIFSLFLENDFANFTDISSNPYALYEFFTYDDKIINANDLLLPATSLAEDCYEGMFKGCTSLITAPELPATTLANNCYYSMFEGCTKLTTAPSVLPATALTQGCYSFMFQGCTSLTEAPQLPATTLADSCYYNMFKGCTSLTEAPQLPATTLATHCYNDMFINCTNLNHIECLATDISAEGCTSNWVYGVSSSGTFVKAASMTSWPRGDSGIPNGWTIQNK